MRPKGEKIDWQMVHLRLTKELKQVVDADARRSGTTASVIIRRLVAKEYEEELKAMEEN